jgi:hypothetical protein
MSARHNVHVQQSRVDIPQEECCSEETNRIAEVLFQYIFPSAYSFGRLITLLLFIANTGCFKQSFTNLKAYINSSRGHVQCFELS